jgi:hypothetical protein
MLLPHGHHERIPLSCMGRVRSRLGETTSQPLFPSQMRMVWLMGGRSSRCKYPLGQADRNSKGHFKQHLQSLRQNSQPSKQIDPTFKGLG